MIHSRLLFSLSLVIVMALSACASAPPPPPKQWQEYERQTASGHEKYQHGYIEQAQHAYLRALAHAELADSSERIVAASINLGACALQLDQPNEAARAYARAVREARLAKLPVLEWQAQSGLAEAMRRSGDARRALALYAARPDAVTLPNNVRAAAELARAQALADAQQSSEAEQLMTSLEGSLRAQPAPSPWLATWYLTRARILLQAGQLDAAQSAALAALDLDRALHHPPSVADDHRLLGDIAERKGQVDLARDHRERAAAIYRHTGQKVRLQEVTSPAGMIHPASKQPTEK